MKKSSSLRRNAQIWSVKILTALKPMKGAGVGTQPCRTKHSCPVRQQKQKAPATELEAECDFNGAAHLQKTPSL